jgi:diacylglycerol kinase family enzyme
MEQPKNSSDKNLQTKIRDMVGMQGLAGETSVVSPARSVEELVDIALKKNYSTVVAVGSDKLINKVASLLHSKDVVLGVIPIKTGQIINKIIGLDNFEDACFALKKRYIKVVDLAYLYPGRYFITDAQIESDKPFKVELDVDSAKCVLEVTNINIVSPAINTQNLNNNNEEQTDNRLNIYISNSSQEASSLKKFYYWLNGNKIQDKSNCIFRARKFIINSETPTPVTINGEIVDKTPVIFTTKPKALKIITNRVKIV